VGISIFLVGLFKKVVLADSISPYASGTFSAVEAGEIVSFAEAWGAVLAYTLQIYFDFSAYSDMALGLGRLFNLHLPINFNSPYKAISIIDFWRRWHITLSHFLRDYLYIPLGGNRKGNILRLVNILLVMLLGGLWHGAAWSFVIWGGIHGGYIVINHIWRSSGLILPRPLAAMLTFLAVVIAWVFFRAGTLDGALLLLHAMSGMQGVILNVDDKLLNILVVGFLWVWLLPNTAQLFAAELPRQVLQTAAVPTEAGWLQRKGLCWTPRPAAALVLGVCFALVLTYLWKSSEFIYFQF
jgi:D-alanyl-lipoteichoic acid acyltransferase DltB (MBOAT superfamily)